MLLAKELVISSLINNQSTFPLQLTSNIDFSPDSEAYIYIYIYFNYSGENQLYLHTWQAVHHDQNRLSDCE